MQDTHKRRFPRLPLNIEITYAVANRTTDAGTTKSINVSIGGICLVLAECLDVGTELNVVLRLPDSYNAVSVTGRVTWTERCRIGTEYTFNTGVEFVAVEGDGRERLRTFVTGSTT